MRGQILHESRQGNRSALPSRSSSRRWHRFLVSGAPLALAVGLTGCGNMNRPGLFRRKPSGPETSGATIGHDFRSWPAGTTIPPAGLGVDLVRSQGSQPQQGSGIARPLPRTDTVTQAAIQNEPAQGQQPAQNEADH